MKKTLKILAVTIGILVILFFVLPGYVKKAIWHLGPSIDDYKIFHNRVIAAGEYQPWEEAGRYNEVLVPDGLRESIEK